MSQALGEIEAQIPSTGPHPVVRTSTEAPRGKFGTMLMSLADRIMPSGGPEEVLELAALLESEGITDAVAARYEATSVFSLSRELLAAAPPARPAIASRPVSQAAAEKLLPCLMRSMLMLGMMGIMLVGVQSYEGAMHAIGVPDQATMLGLFAGMVIAGGMTQAIGWRVSVALSQGTRAVVSPVMRLGLVCGMSVALLAAAALVGIGATEGLSSAGLVGLAASCLGLTLLLLLGGALVLVHQTHLVSIGLGLAGAIVWLATALGLTHASVFATIALGYTTAIGLLGALLALVIYRLSYGGTVRSEHRLPPLGQLMYHAVPYLCYGALAVLYVFSGQVTGWFAWLPPGWSRGQAIAALNIAHLLGLATIVLSQGFAEYGLRIFWHVAREAQAYTKLVDTAQLQLLVNRFLSRYARMVLLSQVAIAVVCGALATWAWQAFDLAATLGPLVPGMLYACLAGYSLLAWGLFGCGFAVTVAHPWLAVRALFVAALLQLASGVALGMYGGVAASTAGTIVGGAVLVLIGRRTLRNLLDRVDYLLYQAF